MQSLFNYFVCCFKSNHDKPLYKSEIEKEELRSRIEKAKDKRLQNQKLEGDDLGSIKGGEESSLLSAADWVNRSRKRELASKCPSIQCF
jgi:hypothetical protein